MGEISFSMKAYSTSNEAYGNYIAELARQNKILAELEKSSFPLK